MAVQLLRNLINQIVNTRAPHFFAAVDIAKIFLTVRASHVHHGVCGICALGGHQNNLKQTANRIILKKIYSIAAPAINEMKNHKKKCIKMEKIRGMNVSQINL